MQYSTQQLSIEDDQYAVTLVPPSSEQIEDGNEGDIDGLHEHEQENLLYECQFATQSDFHNQDIIPHGSRFSNSSEHYLFGPMDGQIDLNERRVPEYVTICLI